MAVRVAVSFRPAVAVAGAASAPVPVPQPRILGRAVTDEAPQTARAVDAAVLAAFAQVRDDLESTLGAWVSSL